MSGHWFVPVSACAECGEPLGGPNHLVRCGAIWSFGPGFAFCEESKGHDGPHRLRNWDGVLYLGFADGSWEKTDDVKPILLGH